MFDVFQSKFPHDTMEKPITSEIKDADAPQEVVEFIMKFGGISFDGGLYRTVSADNYTDWLERLSLSFPKIPGSTAVFGYDWQGDVFAVNSQTLIRGKPGVLLFEIGSAEVLELPFNIEDFHDRGLIQDKDRILTAHGYKKWISRGGKRPSYTECIGYKIPLFLGGEDDYKNLELSDIDVYWHILGQIMHERIWSQ